MPYSDECVLTFEQIRQQMEKAMESIKNPNKNARKSPNEADLKIRAQDLYQRFR